MSEQVAVPLSALAKHEGWWHLDVFEDEASLRRQYKIIETLRRLTRTSDMEYMGRDWTAEDAELFLVRRRCVRRKKKGDRWDEIADSLGISYKNLCRKRKKVFDPSHPLHPDSDTELAQTMSS